MRSSIKGGICAAGVGAMFIAAAAIAGLTMQVAGTSAAQAADEYEVKIKPEWNDKGELLLPKDFRQWVFIGAPLTPHGMNDGKANFPEFHNVYVQPEVFKAYRETGKWPIGTMMLKELQLIDDPKGEFPDTSRYEPSGRGYFPGPVNGVDVAVKDPKRFPNSKGWGYFNFNHSAPPYKAAAAVEPVEKCAQCHIDNRSRRYGLREALQADSHAAAPPVSGVLTRHRYVHCVPAAVSPLLVLSFRPAAAQQPTLRACTRDCVGLGFTNKAALEHSR